MGVILQELRQLLVKNIEDHGVVLWFDAEHHYDEALGPIEATLGDSRAWLVRFDGSYFKLRSELQPSLSAPAPPRVLIYLAEEYEKARSPLIELLTLGRCLRPGEKGLQNTKLAVIARRALKDRIGEARLAGLEREIAAGQLGWAELERLGEEADAAALSTGLSAIFATADAEAAALAFLADTRHDQQLTTRNAVADWAQALLAHFALPVHPGLSLVEIRAELARQALIADLIETAAEALPPALSRLHVPQDGAGQRLVALARNWRNRRDYATSYAAAALAVEEKLRLAAVEFSDTALQRVTTFPSLERRLLATIANRLTSVADADATGVVEARLQGFWAAQNPELRTEWTLLAQANALITRAQAVQRELEAIGTQADTNLAAAIAMAYTRPAPGWSDMDALHRRLEGLVQSWEAAVVNPSPPIEALLTRARRSHAATAAGLAEAFLRAWQVSSFALPTPHRQTEVFATFVAPARGRGRTAYVLVDALRFEMGRELADKLESEFEVDLDAVIGTPPTITTVGMAALLPGASQLQIAGNPLEVSLDGKKLPTRQSRMKFLADREKPIVELRLEDPRQFRRKLKDAPPQALVVVTSQEIDQSGEGGLSGALRHMAEVLDHLVVAARRLAEAGIENIVITADHGFLFGDELAETDKVDPPGGETLLLHRRIWIGKGGAASESTLRAPLSAFGLQSDLDLATPWNCAGFRAPGPDDYFHGGLSPQEILLPVLSLRPRPRAAKSAKLNWSIVPGTGKITSLFLSLRLTAAPADLFDATWPQVRVEVRCGAKICSAIINAAYGFDPARQTVAMGPEPNTVALLLNSKTPQRGNVTIAVMEGDVELAKFENVEVALGI